MRKLITTLSLLATAIPAHAEEAPFITSRVLTPGIATTGVMATIDDCAKRGFQTTVAIVGRDGNLLAFARHPLAGPHTIEVAKRKAWTANTFRTPTLTLQSGENNNFMRSIPGALLIGGGVPISVGGHLYGAIGVSGAPREKQPGDVDHYCAEAGIKAMAETLELAGD